MDAGRHIYWLKQGAQIWYFTLGIMLGCFSLILFGILLMYGGWSKHYGEFSIFAFLFGYFSCVTLLFAVRSRVVIDNGRLMVRGAFSETSVDLSELAGSKITADRSSTYWTLSTQEGEKIYISRRFEVDDDFQDLMSKLEKGESVANITG